MTRYDDIVIRDDRLVQEAHIKVWELEWDDRNESHCLMHDITPELAEEVKGREPRFFPNKQGRTGTHAMIGPDARGRIWTIVLLETAMEGRWRPITGWPSDNAELVLYNSARRLPSEETTDG